MASNKVEALKKEVEVMTPPQLSLADVAAMRARHRQPPTRSTPMANKIPAEGRQHHYSTMPLGAFESPHHNPDSGNCRAREKSTDSAVFSTSLPYSWTDSYLDESPSEMRQRWLNKQTFGPVLQSEGYNTEVSTPYVYRTGASVWGQRGNHSGEIVENDVDSCHITKPLSFTSQASTAFAPAQVGKRQIVKTRHPKLGQEVKTSQHESSSSAPLAEAPSPHQSRSVVVVASAAQSCEPQATASMELQRLDSKRSISRGIARGRPVQAIFDDEDDFFQ